MAIELPASEDGRSRSLRREWRPLLAILLVSLLWRVPSLFDPPWVNDEGTYFAIAQAMRHGIRLYAGVWENKPPAIYLVYAAVYHSFGASVAAVHVLATLAVLVLVVLVAAIGRAYVSRDGALFAALLCGLLMGVPFLEGTTANAEVFLALFAALGVYLAIGRDSQAAAGIAMGIAVLFKAVALFDAAALALWLAVNYRASLRTYLPGLALPLLAACLVAWHAGILHPMLRDALLYNVGYVGHGNGGSFPWLLAVKLVALAALTILLRRASFPFLWLAYAAAGSLLSGRIFGHYVLEAIAPLSLTVSIFLDRRGLLPRRALGGLVLAFVLAAAACGAAGWIMASSGHDSILARRLQYYPNFVRYAAHTETYATYRGQIDDHVNRNLAVVGALRRLPPGPLLVWGNTPWVYPLSGRLPATAYTSALREPEVPGETAALREAVSRTLPSVVVVISPPLPPLGSASDGLHRFYRRAARVEDATIYARARFASSQVHG